MFGSIRWFLLKCLYIYARTSKLVYFEEHREAENAIKREKRLKFWKRRWKLELIEKHNPGWKDLYEKIAV